MFRRRKEYKKRGNFLPFVIFRFLLSLVIFALLMGGLYSAFKSFSGVNPLSLDPKSLVLSMLHNYPEAREIINQILPSSPQATPKTAEDLLGKINTSITDPSDAQKPKDPARNELFKFALIADSHNENGYLAKALAQAKESQVRFIIGLGDYTEVGSESELERAKQAFDGVGVRYFLTPGDHDLWDSRNKNIAAGTNFNKFFGSAYQSFSVENVRMIILDNSDNYLGLGSKQMNWLSLELEKIKQEPKSLVLAFMHEPLYHPSSDHVMGKVTPSLKDSAKSLTQILKNNGVSEVFAGDIHYFTRYVEPTTNLSMTTLGAVASQRNTQLPRYGLVTIFEDYSYIVEDVEIK